MGLFLILLGVVIWIFLSAALGLVLIIVGIFVFLFVEAAPYGYSHFRRRRGGGPY
jgi:hypothetical protein